MNSEILETIQIVPIAEEHIESLHRCFDAVARERKYLARVQAPPLETEPIARPNAHRSRETNHPSSYVLRITFHATCITFTDRGGPK
jgi:hypothetical protein